MSTAVDTALEELLANDADLPLHTVCGWCDPDPGPGSLCVCGHVATGGPEDGGGKRRCAKCVALDYGPWPCGHHVWL